MRGELLSIVAGFMFAGAAMAFSEAAASDYVKSETLNTESAVPMREGDIDFEMGLRYSKAEAGKRAYWDNGWNRDRAESFRMYEWEINATMGILPDIDLSMSTGFVDMHDRNFINEIHNSHHARGMDDLDVSLKWRWKNDGNWDIAYIPGITIPIGRHSTPNRIGPGQHYWSFENRLAATREIEEVTLLKLIYIDDLVLNADIGYSFPFGWTRRSYEREWGEHTVHIFSDGRSRSSSERGVLDANVALIRAKGSVRPLVELNYAHRCVSRGNDTAQIHATVGSVVTVDEQWRLKAGYQHPIIGRNAARTKRLMLSLAHTF